MWCVLRRQAINCKFSQGTQSRRTHYLSRCSMRFVQQPCWIHITITGWYLTRRPLHWSSFYDLLCIPVCLKITPNSSSSALWLQQKYLAAKQAVREMSRHGANGFTPPPNECVLRTLIALKKSIASAGIEPASLESSGKHAKYYTVDTTQRPISSRLIQNEMF
jgi:hypothetical protein